MAEEIKPKRKKAASDSTARTRKATPSTLKSPTVKAAPKAQKPSKPEPQPEPKAEQASESRRETPFDAEQFKAMEDLSVNLAKAAITAQTALASAVFKQPEFNGSAPSDPFQVGPAMTNVMNSLAKSPEKMVEAQTDLLTGYMSLWADMTRRSLGGEAGPDTSPKDKRFADPRWQENLVFDMMRRSYLLSSNWLNNLVSSVDGVDPLDKRRAEFFTKLITDAFSPSNFLMSNPAALDTLISTKGESLVKGMQKFADDLARGDGKLKISQADYDHFKVGENVATTPGKVVWRGPLFELLQYSPTTEQVREIPLLIFPPWINKFYILDLQAKNSLIKWLTDQGFTVFVTSWVNPDQSMASLTFEDYMFGGIYQAVAKVREQTGAETVNTVGYCIGGTLLGVTLAHMAAKGDTSIGSATFFTAQHDFSEAGDLLLFTNEAWLTELERQMDAAGGVLPGTAMADTFNSLRANDLVWSFFVNNYLMGKELTAFDLLCWNADQTRMPKTLHMYYLRKFYNENALSKGELNVGGVDIDLKNVKIPIYEQAGREDHIAPPGSVFKGAKLFGGPVTYVMAGSGHIAGVVNAPAAQKYMHWINESSNTKGLPKTLEAWQQDAVEYKGSWWPHWAEWLHAKSGDLIPARDPAKGKFKPLMDAPGSYVLVKS
ncbi:class I poly(R)-hydroxyalkanoic acid synthase [Asticcacaulis sp. BYS171W]|uniref:Class I poly(R)-hydroxyalkanoic acid synthase n=1 Tax=Asticcacaulis aquaticus TaxID=2984212 RepID=A0ABT5HQN6_9CAUL|nr:class I poly(R)-hydroxyalkanoic acid synthase [Asticcacaulis aquaticus]MDC7681771.1 class I poly(R)-hydroxyalkanoic acid synthase [Asticcacaulis aquaticus]